MTSELRPKESNSGPYDVIGKPDPVSNLRPMKFCKPEEETSIERLFRIERTRVQNWNHRFWTKHNNNFRKEKDEFRKRNMFSESHENSHKSDEISVFYRDFLDRHWRAHCSYNFQWYKKNIYLSSLALRVHISRILKYCKLL